MRTLLLATLLAPALALAADSTSTAGDAGVRARLRDTTGKEVGTATLSPADGGTKITMNVSGLPPGKHGFHVHAVGKCDAPDFKSAGPHYNPTGRKHGHDNPEGAHAGDLPNLEVGPDGKGSVTYVAKDLKLTDLLASKDGGALVLHADPDDGKTDPAGNSGARIACGVLER